MTKIPMGWTRRRWQVPTDYPPPRARPSLVRRGGVWCLILRPHDDCTGERTTTTTYPDFASAARAGIAFIAAHPERWRHIACGGNPWSCSGGPECHCDRCARERAVFGEPPDDDVTS